MSTITKVTIPALNEILCQGDIFSNLKYSYIDDETDEYVDILEYEFPLSVIVSQACDVTFMSQLQSDKNGKPTKFMPSVLLCPIYNGDAVKDNRHLADISITTGIVLDTEQFFTSKVRDVTKNDMHYRFHQLDAENNESRVIRNGLVDFKHYFSVSASYLLKSRDNRRYRLESLFTEQITLRFAAYLSRVAIP